MTAVQVGTDYRHTAQTVFFEGRGYPVLVAHGLLPAGKLRHSEGGSLDVQAGIDWVVSQPDGGTIGLAMRVQKPPDYNTFSIRLKTVRGGQTELEKRLNTARAGGLLPTLTVQMYVDLKAGDVLAAYVVRTYQLIRHIYRGTRPDGWVDLCDCVGDSKMAPGGNLFVPVAVGDRGRVAAGTRGDLLSHGVDVRSLGPTPYTPALWEVD